MKISKTRKQLWQNYRHNCDHLSEHDRIQALIDISRLFGLPLSDDEDALYRTALSVPTNPPVSVEEIMSGLTLDDLLERKEIIMENGTQRLVRDGNTFRYES